MRGFLATLALLFTATFAQAAGLRSIEVPADGEGPALRGAMWSPCSKAPGEIDLGTITVPGVKDCPIDGEKLPLVVISHGRGGSFIGHHDIAEMLADAGFVAAAINHPGDTASDLSRSGDLSVFIERPTDIRRLIDFVIDTSPAASRIDVERIGFLASRAVVTRASCWSAPIPIGPVPAPYANNPQVLSASSSTAKDSRRDRAYGVSGRLLQQVPGETRL